MIVEQLVQAQLALYELQLIIVLQHLLLGGDKLKPVEQEEQVHPEE